MKQLDARGLLTPATDASWVATRYHQRAGWSYPIYHYASGDVIGRRWKSADGTRPKYLWQPNKPEDPAADWYILPGTAEHIAAAGGEVYLANGEPALLAYVAAGVGNVITTTASEITVPNTVLQVLGTLGATRVVYPVDKDAAGRQSAVAWRDALAGTGIDYEALAWGDAAPPKGDANDVWQQVGFCADAFVRTLDRLEALPLPTPEPQPVVSSVPDETPDGLVTRLAERLGVTGWKSNGWSRRNVRCPHHDDRVPSAGLNRDSGVLHCFVCGAHSARVTAEALGIDWQPFYATPDEIVIDEPPDLPLPRKAFPDGLPDAWQRALAQYAPRYTAPVLHGIVNAIRDDRLDSRGYTVADVQRVLAAQNMNFSRHTVRAVLESEFVEVLEDTERDQRCF
jgi:hypothetical protein